MICLRSLAPTLLLASLLANLSCGGGGCKRREYTISSRVEVTGTPVEAEVVASTIRNVDLDGSTPDRLEQEFSVSISDDIDLSWFFNAPPPLTLPETGDDTFSSLLLGRGDLGSTCSFFLQEYITELKWSPSIGELDGGEVPQDFFRHVEFRLKITSSMFENECDWPNAPDIDLKIEMEATSEDVSYTGANCGA